MSDDQIQNLLNNVSEFYVISRFYVAFGADLQYHKIEIRLYYHFSPFQIKYPANCATRLSVEANAATLLRANDDINNSNLEKQLYEAKPDKKIVRIITVIAYIFSGKKDRHTV